MHLRFTSLLLAVAGLSFGCSDDTSPADGGGAAGGNGGSGDGGTPTSGGGGDGGAGDGGFVTDGGGGSDPTGGGGDGGAGGEAGWPTCDVQPPGSPTKTLSEIWDDDPTVPAEAWVPNVYVTAVSKDGCIAGEACQIFVQQNESYGSIAEATHQSLRIGIAPTVSQYFVDVFVGDQINLYAHAVRDTMDGKNELFFLVTPNLPGCAAFVDFGNPQPLVVTLDDLTLAAYETDVGPMLVEVDLVTGNPNGPAQTFALWDTGSVPDGDLTTVTSLSPFFLPDATFSGLTQDVITDFEYVIGVFGIFAPPADPLIKYEEIYVRSDLDYPPAN